MELTKEQLIIWRQQGMSNVDIAHKIGKSISSVNMLFSQYKIPKRRTGLPEEKAEAIAMMGKEGKSTKEIAERLGISITTVHNYLKAAGLIPDKKKDGEKKEDEPEAFIMAVQRKPRIFRAFYSGRWYKDVTDLHLLG